MSPQEAGTSGISGGVDGDRGNNGLKVLIVGAGIGVNSIHCLDP